jgi:hypothetical protein
MAVLQHQVKEIRVARQTHGLLRMAGYLAVVVVLVAKGGLQQTTILAALAALLVAPAWHHLLQVLLQLMRLALKPIGLILLAQMERQTQEMAAVVQEVKKPQV